MWENLKAAMAKGAKAVSDYLVAHPVIKHLLNACLYACLGAAWAYVGPLLQPGHTGSFTLQGLGFAIAGAFKAWLDANHAVVVANLQDQVQALLAVAPAGTAPPPTTSSALTPIEKPVGTSVAKPLFFKPKDDSDELVDNGMGKMVPKSSLTKKP